MVCGRERLRLLNVNLTAECRLIGNAAPPTGAANWVEIRVMLVRGGSFVGFMQPNDTGSHGFCSADEYAMHSANLRHVSAAAQRGYLHRSGAIQSKRCVWSHSLARRL